MNVSTTRFDIETGGIYVSTAVVTISDKGLDVETNYTPVPESIAKAELREKHRLINNQNYLRIRRKR